VGTVEQLMYEGVASAAGGVDITKDPFLHIASRPPAVEKKGPLYEALGVTIGYEHATRTATVESRPSSPYRQSLCPRGELTAGDTSVIAQGRVRLQDLSGTANRASHGA
jgi:hypothetical protein